MKNFLVSVLAGVLFASFSFAANRDVKDAIVKEAKEYKEAILKMEDVKVTENLLKSIKEFSAGSDTDSRAVLDAMKSIYKDKEKLVDTISLFAKAKQKNDPEANKVLKQLAYMVVRAANSGDKTAYDVVAPYIGAAKLAITEMDEKGSRNLQFHISEINTVLSKVGTGHSSLSLEEASLLAFANMKAFASGEGNKAIIDVKVARDKYGVEFEEWKIRCKI